MRLWHYKIIKYLPDLQLIAQWRELNSIYKNKNRHILINYVYECSKVDLEFYSLLVLNEITKRNIKIHSIDNFMEYFHYLAEPDILGFRVKNAYSLLGNGKLFEGYHTDRYLLQCFYNLQEKFDRGQKGFDKERYEALEEFVRNEIH